MTFARPDGATRDTAGPIGPVAVLALLVLLVASPLMRGGNRHVALIVLEGIALAFLVAALAGTRAPGTRVSFSQGLLVFLVTSPLWLALVYLLPIPLAWWRATAGRGVYPEVLTTAGVVLSDKLPLSLVPDATAASLFAGIPIVAAFVAGYAMRLRQLKLAVRVFVVIAFLQVVIGVLQVAGGASSSLYFGAVGGRPFGTFANPNHFANYVGMALVAYIWLAWAQLAEDRPYIWAQHRLTRGRALALWIAGAVFLALGILMSRSRGATLSVLPAAMGAFAIAVTAGSRGTSKRTTLIIAGIALLAAVSLAGVDSVVSRFRLSTMAGDASFRTLLATSSLEGAAQFWPWGAGWGTYQGVYPRFQPPNIVGAANYAHQDYAQLLFEGGIFSVLLMAAFGWLALARVVQLVRAALRRGRLRREEIASALFGVALLGFLLHSLVEFNMHIPANAIVAALLAGAFLRPLEREQEPEDD